MNIVISGVGGQGTLLAARAIAEAAICKGFEVRTSETIGMAQREGSVVSHVRLGHNLNGALIPDHKADILLGFELAETVRAIGKLKPGGVIISNTHRIMPVSVSLGSAGYRSDKMISSLAQATDRLILLDATQAASKAGGYKSANVVLLGVLSGLPELPFHPADLWQAIMQHVSPRTRQINQAAFELGQRIIAENRNTVSG